ncbi:MAG: hypothetical protein IIA64_10520, partial [Planctomycetes bacterium]|nr:hypothetical protein [Planctomycetota bacterium]
GPTLSSFILDLEATSLSLLGTLLLLAGLRRLIGGFLRRWFGNRRDAHGQIITINNELFGQRNLATGLFSTAIYLVLVFGLIEEDLLNITGNRLAATYNMLGVWLLGLIIVLLHSWLYLGFGPKQHILHESFHENNPAAPTSRLVLLAGILILNQRLMDPFPAGVHMFSSWEHWQFLLLGVVAGADRHDSTCADRPVPDYVAQLDTPTKPIRIGVPKQFLSDDNDPGVNAAVRDAIAVYRSHGAAIIEIDLPLSEYGIATYYVIAPAEASSNLARYDGIRYGRRAELGSADGLLDLYARSRAEGFGPEVQRRIMLGTYVLSAGYYDAYYKRALQVRRLIKQELDAAFAQCDALLGPTAPTVAFSLGEKADPLSMYLCDVYTTIANIAGICAISIPAGFVSIDGKRLPVGIQIQCQAFDEATMFRIARMFEAATDHHTHRPDIDDPVRSTDIAR